MHKPESITTGAQDIELSVVVPIYNEERFIERCVTSLMHQDYPINRVEIMLVDGRSTDSTPRILRELEERYPETVRVFDNPGRIQSCAMNIGMRNARGKYLMRIDAHAEYPDKYFKVCTTLLEEKGADNVGCSWITSSRTDSGRLIAKMLSTSFAVGGSKFRTNAPSGFVDTVPFGTFRTDFLKEMGGFDERLARSEDNELNYRIRKNGGKVYLTNEICTTYYCRETISSLARMAFDNGKWNVIAAYLCPGSMSIKYFVPLAFAVSLVLLPLLSLIDTRVLFLLGGELALYLFLAARSCRTQTQEALDIAQMVWLYPLFHVSYGIGSLAGIASLFTKDFKENR